MPYHYKPRLLRDSKKSNKLLKFTSSFAVLALTYSLPNFTTIQFNEPKFKTPVIEVQSVALNKVTVEKVSFTPRVYTHEEFEEVAKPIFDKYKIPYKVGFGMWAAECRLECFAAERNNFYNIAAFDHNPDLAYKFESAEMGIEAFSRFISGTYTSYASNVVKNRFKEAHEAYLKSGNAEQFMIDIQNAGYAGDPSTYYWRADNGYSSYASFVMQTPEWNNN